MSFDLNTADDIETSPGDTLPSPALQRQIEDLGPWFHNLRLNGIQTAPHHFLGDYPQIKFESFRDAIPADLTGKTVLDIGCNAGFYSLEMKRRGAARVVGIDSDRALPPPGPLRRRSRRSRHRVPPPLRLGCRRARRDIRPRHLHGRALSPAPPAARPRPHPRARRPRPAALPEHAARQPRCC